MTLSEILKALNEGKKVFWFDKGYKVTKDSITCIKNNDSIGLTWLDGITLNGKESDFFIGE